jgi:hypothetical protein
MTNIISPAELPIIKSYVGRKKEAFGSAALLELQKVGSVPEFDAWRVKWLTAADWNRLRVALRLRKHRDKYRGQRVRLTVTRETHRALKLRAQQSGSTISQTLTKLISNAQ